MSIFLLEPFGIYKRKNIADAPSKTDVLRKGSELVAAGYTLYGSATTLFFSTGDGVHGFILDPLSGEFVLTHHNIKIKNKHNIYSINEGNSLYWHEPTKKYVDSIKNPTPPGKPYSLRYVGSMVADVHRTLIYGGIFMYPADKNSPNGKLRLLYEANPMSYIIEQAGGKATDGTRRILDIEPTEVHQRVPIYLGSKGNVEELESFFKEGAH